MEKEKLETLIELAIKAWLVKNRVVVSAFKIALGFALTLMLLVGIQVGRIAQLMLG